MRIDRVRVSAAYCRIVAAAANIHSRIRTGDLSPTPAQIQLLLFLVGVGLLTVGMDTELWAQRRSGDVEFNDDRIAKAVGVLFAHLEGSFGALVMVASGVGAILSSAFGQYRASLGLMVVAIGAFILRSLTATFFNDDSFKDL